MKYTYFNENGSTMRLDKVIGSMVDGASVKVYLEGIAEPMMIYCSSRADAFQMWDKLQRALGVAC